VPTWLSNALDLVVTFVPKLLLALVILIVGLIIARLLAKAVEKLLERVGFDRLVERGGVKTALDRSRFDASDIVAKIVYWALVLVTLQFAFGVFGPNPISAWLASIVAYLPNVIVAIIIVIIAAAIAAGVRSLLEGALGGLSYGRVIANLVGAFILFLGVIAALNQVGIAFSVTTPVLIAVLATISGILIVGVGGGLIKPMQQRWEGYLTRAEEDVTRARAEAQLNSPTTPTTGTTQTLPAATAVPRTTRASRARTARPAPGMPDDGSRL
jgi:hypothetical protein